MTLTVGANGARTQTTATESNSKLLYYADSLWYNIITTNKGGDFMETKDIIYELRTKKGALARGACRKNICYKAGCISVGKRRNDTEYRYAEAPFRIV